MYSVELFVNYKKINGYQLNDERSHRTFIVSHLRFTYNLTRFCLSILSFFALAKTLFLSIPHLEIAPCFNNLNICRLLRYNTNCYTPIGPHSQTQLSSNMAWVEKTRALLIFRQRVCSMFNRIPINICGIAYWKEVCNWHYRRKTLFDSDTNRY